MKQSKPMFVIFLWNFKDILSKTHIKTSLNAVKLAIGETYHAVFWLPSSLEREGVVSLEVDTNQLTPIKIINFKKRCIVLDVIYRKC